MDKVNTKRIKTKKERNLRILDIIFIIFCILHVEIKFDFESVKFLIAVISSCNNIINLLIVIIFYLCGYFLYQLIFNWVFIAIYLGFRILRMKNIKQNSKYKVIDNIEYYRDRFNNISPAEISLITDLEIEQKKDITASILSLYQKGIVRFEEKNIVINEIKCNEYLRPSEQELIEMIKINDYSSIRIDNWKNKCIKEAEENNYIREKNVNEIINEINSAAKADDKTTKIVRNIFIISLLLGMIYVSWNQQLFDKLDELEKLTTIDMKSLLTKEGIDGIVYIAPFMLLSCIFMGSFFTLIGIPIYRKIKRKIHNYNSSRNLYERTNESNILVEQIAGIKNFIHDFSLLSEKEKEDVLLWEDFLIYAIVLEENENIISDIFKYKNINLDIKSNILNIIDII